MFIKTPKSNKYPNNDNYAKINKITFLKSVALIVPSSETWNLYFLPVRLSEMDKEPDKLGGGETKTWAETGDDSRTGMKSLDSIQAERWADKTANRPRAEIVVVNSSAATIFVESIWCWKLVVIWYDIKQSVACKIDLIKFLFVILILFFN